MNEVATVKKEISDLVLEKIAGMEEKKQIYFPANYSPENAINSAFLIIQQTVDMSRKPALEVCTRDSIANALLDTVIQGLSPAKKQVYYIVRGDKLCADRSYFGTVAVVKRIKGVVDVFGQAIFEGDKFDFDIIQARKVITVHKQTLETIATGKVIGAYSTIVYRGDSGDLKEYSEVMTIQQIEQSWEKSKNKSKTIHKETPDQMAIRTVLNRGCKLFINSSDDSDLEFVAHSFNQTDGREEYPKSDANTETIVIPENREEPDQTKQKESNAIIDEETGLEF